MGRKRRRRPDCRIQPEPEERDGSTALAAERRPRRAKCYIVYMNELPSVSVRELRQNLSRYLRRVEAGETLEVVSRGRRVAQLAPLPDRADIVDRLVADGRAIPASGDLLSLGPPLQLATKRSASDALAEERRDSR